MTIYTKIYKGPGNEILEFKILTEPLWLLIQEGTANKASCKFLYIVNIFNGHLRSLLKMNFD